MKLFSCIVRADQGLVPVFLIEQGKHLPCGESAMVDTLISTQQAVGAGHSGLLIDVCCALMRQLPLTAVSGLIELQ